MFQPCHIVAACLVYCMFWQTERSAFVFNIMTFWGFHSIAAILFPDNKEKDQPLEVTAFWIHHVLLLLIPLKILLSERYIIERSSYFFWCISSLLAMFLNFNIILPLDLVTSINVNYMLSPPPSAPFNGPFYRIQTAFFLVIPCWFVGFTLVGLVEKLSGKVFDPLLQKKKV